MNQPEIPQRGTAQPHRWPDYADTRAFASRVDVFLNNQIALKVICFEQGKTGHIIRYRPENSTELVNGHVIVCWKGGAS